ncbi:MAG TPA: tyrosine-type recombinase/integrase [Anaerohalosphaeraceae bacterium]|nr:tyrosine-type recombinase/integrase [Anaerohalosphaeraceae bacterium]
MPTKTPLTDILERFIKFMETFKTAKSLQTDIYYLRSIFGDICPALKITSRKRSPRQQKKQDLKIDKRVKPKTIEAACIEDITTADITEFITAQVRSRGLAPKTANRYREILHRFFSWATKQAGVKMPGNTNPAAEVERYKEKAPEISFLTLKQIDEQLTALKDKPQLQTMIATLIYAGLRREELLWLTLDDIDFKSGPYGIIRVRAKTVNEEYWQPKTKVNRAIPISSTLRKILDSYAPRPSRGRWFFPSPCGLRYDPDNFSRELENAQPEGLKWTCLDFRHTFGSQLAMKGESLYKISKLMGNSPEICRRHYAALIPESLTESVEFGTESAQKKVS